LTNRGTWQSGHTYDPDDYVFAPNNSGVSSMWIMQAQGPYTSTIPPKDDAANWAQFTSPPGPTGPTGARGPTGPAGIGEISVANVMEFGAVGDGTADDSAAFIAALQTGLAVVYAPATPSGYFLSQGLTLVAGTVLKGDPASPGSGLIPQGTVLMFATPVMTCVTLDGGAGVIAQGIRDLVITREWHGVPMAEPPRGSIGVLVRSSYNVSLVDVFSWNHAKPMVFQAATSGSGVNSNSINATRVFLGAATDVFLEVSGWPEIRWNEGRFGCPNDFAGSNAFVRVTGGVSDNSIPGTGPNSLCFVNVQMNTAGGKPTQNLMTFDDMLGGGATACIFKFDDGHIEGVSGALFHSNSGTSLIDQVFMSNMTCNTLGDVFDLDPTTSLSNIFFCNTKFAGGMTVNVPTLNNFKAIGCTFGGNVSVTGNGTATAILADNHFTGNVALFGSWTGLMMMGGDIWGDFGYALNGLAQIFVPPKAIVFNARNDQPAGNRRGDNAYDWQQIRFAPWQVASGAQSVIAGGDQNAATGQKSVVSGGSSSMCDADFGWIPGGKGAHTHATFGKGAWASGSFGQAGDAQAGELVLRGHSTNNGGVIMTSDGLDESTTNTLVLAQFSACIVRLLGVVRQGTNDNQALAAGWDLTMLAKRGSGTDVSIVGGLPPNTPISPTWGDTSLIADVFLQVMVNDPGNGIMIQAWCPSGDHGDLYWVVRAISVEVVA
jgi:Pectate lyase superfamily protein